MKNEFYNGERVKGITGNGETIVGIFTDIKAEPVRIGGKSYDIKASNPVIIDEKGVKHYFGDLPDLIIKMEKYEK